MKYAKGFLGAVTCGASTHHGLCGELGIKANVKKAAFGDLWMVTSPEGDTATVCLGLGEVAVAPRHDAHSRKAELVEELSRQGVSTQVLSSDYVKKPIPNLKKTLLKVSGSVPRILALRKPAPEAKTEEPAAFKPKTPDLPTPKPRTVAAKTRRPPASEQPTLESRTPEVKPQQPQTSEPKALEPRTGKPKHREAKTHKVKLPLPKPIELETVVEKALEFARPAPLEIPAHVPVKVIPTPRKRETKQPDPAVQQPAELPAMRPLKVMRRRREEAPKVFETIATAVPQAMLAGIAPLRDEGEPK